ncbi:MULTISPECIES: hypothetical protein [unclassified Nostoc]|uniref:hypothetical protein n=1 Tax=unclassified Nostoc TaxID=2593658 RepID=UPI001D2C13B7|nr:hypothetical protein [Nostoc sp. JL23]MBN3877943.1 hypothetical protein [Nostoc sp. JL23]
MNNENTTNNIPQPDPSWDCYLTHHRLLKAKSDIDKLIRFISDLESATATFDQSINEDLFELVSDLENIRIPIADA